MSSAVATVVREAVAEVAAERPGKARTLKHELSDGTTASTFTRRAYTHVTSSTGHKYEPLHHHGKRRVVSWHTSHKGADKRAKELVRGGWGRVLIEPVSPPPGSTPPPVDPEAPGGTTPPHPDPSGGIVSEAPSVQELLESAFDEVLHPRDRGGRWAAKIGALRVGGRLRIGSVKVERAGPSSHKVAGAGSPPSIHATAAEAGAEVAKRLQKAGTADPFETQFHERMAGLSREPTGDNYPSQYRRQGLLETKTAAGRAHAGIPLTEDERAALSWWHSEGKQGLSDSERKWLADFQFSGDPGTQALLNDQVPHPSNVSRAASPATPRAAQNIANYERNRLSKVVARKPKRELRPTTESAERSDMSVAEAVEAALQEGGLFEEHLHPRDRGGKFAISGIKIGHVVQFSHKSPQGFLRGRVTGKGRGHVTLKLSEPGTNQNEMKVAHGRLTHVLVPGGGSTGESHYMIGGTAFPHSAVHSLFQTQAREQGHPNPTAFANQQVAKLAPVSKSGGPSPLGTPQGDKWTPIAQPSTAASHGRYTVRNEPDLAKHNGSPSARSHWDNTPNEPGVVGSKKLGASVEKQNGKVNAVYYRANGSLRQLGDFASHEHAHKAIVKASESASRRTKKSPVKESEEASTFDGFPMEWSCEQIHEALIQEGLSIQEADLSTGGRKKMADKGEARPDGSFPIPNTSYLKKAIRALGRASNPAAAKAWIIKRAKALKAVGMLPSSWGVQETADERPTVAEAIEQSLLMESALDFEPVREVDLPSSEMILEAADSLAKASTPEPFSKSKTSNWVARTGGLPAYVQHIAHDLMEDKKHPRTESEAIRLAVGIVKNPPASWDANAKAAAAKAAAEWEEKRGRAKVKESEDTVDYEELVEAALQEADSVEADAKAGEKVLCPKDKTRVTATSKGTCPKCGADLKPLMKARDNMQRKSNVSESVQEAVAEALTA